jgi:hypothetical protein
MAPPLTGDAYRHQPLLNNHNEQVNRSAAVCWPPAKSARKNSAGPRILGSAVDAQQSWEELQLIQRRKAGGKRLCCPCLAPRSRRILVIVLVLLALIASGLFVAFYYTVPMLLQNGFRDFKAVGSLPPMDFWEINTHWMAFNTSFTLPVNNFVDTVIELQEPLLFSVDNETIAELPFPVMFASPTVRPTIEGNFTMRIRNVKRWEALWRRWIARAVNNNVPEEWKRETVWQLSSKAKVKMLGLEWKDIELSKEIKWNGGMPHRWSVDVDDA